MTWYEEFKQKSKEGIKNLRKKSLLEGHAFLIYDQNLPKGQTYREYPDGSIRIERLDPNESKFIVVKALDRSQADSVRDNFLSNLS